MSITRSTPRQGAANIVLAARIATCSALICASGAAYDAITAAAHAVIRAAGRIHDRIDSRLYQHWTRLKGTRDMPDRITQPSESMGDRVLRAVMHVAIGIVVVLWISDMTENYAGLLVAMWSGQ